MKHAIVTGTSRGIGTATAKELLERGWFVTGVARTAAPESLDGAEHYEHAMLDLTDPGATESWFEEMLAPRLAASTPERLALVNNAGTLDPMKPIVRIGAFETARAFTLNVAVPLWLMGFALRQSRDIPLRIVNLSSGAASSAYPGWAAYCGTKSALRMVGEVLSLELQEVDELQGRDVAVISYAPHVVATQMQEEIRAMDTSDFPRQQRFVALERDGHLVSADGPAREIAALAEADDLPVHDERRFVPGSLTE